MTAKLDVVLLDEIDALTEFKLANMLDVQTAWHNIWLDAVTFKKGWPELAALLYFNAIDIKRCEMAPAIGRSCAQEMIKTAIQRYPNYTLTWLYKKLCLIKRGDAAEILLHTKIQGTPNSCRLLAHL